MLKKFSTFVGEVKGELRKASWPWDPDPKVKGFKKYKELIADKAYLGEVLRNGAEAAWRRANKIMRKVYRKVGFPDQAG